MRKTSMFAVVTLLAASPAFAQPPPATVKPLPNASLTGIPPRNAKTDARVVRAWKRGFVVSLANPSIRADGVGQVLEIAPP